MNINKSEIKMAIAQDLGKKFEERESALKTEANRLEGAQGALKQAAGQLDAIKTFYQKEVDDNNFEEANLQFVMRAIDRCRGVLINMADVASAQKLVKDGEVQASKWALDQIEKIYTTEREKLDAILKSIEDGTLAAEDTSPALDGGTAVRLIDNRVMNPAAADLASRRAEAREARMKEEATNPSALEVPESLKNVLLTQETSVQPEEPQEPVEAEPPAQEETPPPAVEERVVEEPKALRPKPVVAPRKQTVLRRGR